MTDPRASSKLPVERLRRRQSADELGFETTEELEDLPGMLGQGRAEEALRFGLGIASKGFNVFVLGPPGMGKHRLVNRAIEARAAAGAVPNDWIYVYCFKDADKPSALSLPPGRGAQLQKALDRLIEELKVAIPQSFETDEYRNRHRVLEQKVEARHEEAFDKLSTHAEEKGLRLLRTPMGFAFAPVLHGEVLSPEQFSRLESEKQDEVKKSLEDLQEELRALMDQLPKWQREAREELRQLDREVAGYAAVHHMQEVIDAFADLERIRKWLDEVKHDIVEHAHELKDGGGEESAEAAVARALQHGMGRLARYRVNLFVDRSEQKGAPVVYEDNPTLDALVGRVDQRAQLGMLVSDFTLIKPGALHRANGGYLVLDAMRVLTSPSVWDSLKRALRAGEVRITSLAQSLGLASTMSLEPEPIPLDAKIILVGERRLYYLLAALDPELDQLFKVAADFEDDVSWDGERVREMARLIAGIARSEGLLHLHKGAVARVVERASRIADDQKKLSTEVHRIADLVREADWIARARQAKRIEEADIDTAITAQERREGRVGERTLERYTDGTMLIRTSGAVVGQINGLSVMGVGRTSFGRPMRITCRVRLGKGEVVDIEREVQLGGPLHSKGVLILGGYLGARYALDRPLSLSATLVFEQSYGGVDGDSASLAELCSLLSALADVPIEQRFAVTGSVNQMGDVQAIGGVNEKIEGYFEVCQAAGLDGSHAVLIPESNAQHLMLRSDVVKACSEGRFAIHTMRTVDEAITQLTGVEAGRPGPDGKYPEGTLHARVEKRLSELAEKIRAFAAPLAAIEKPGGSA